jgi:hypothetical protein
MEVRLKMKKYIVLCMIVMFSDIAFCHHAMEYIELESYSTARRGEFVFHLHYDYMVDDKDNPKLDHWEFTPGLSYGITDRLMIDFHTHFAKFGAEHVVEDKRDSYEPLGPSPFMEAGALSLQYRLIEGWFINIGGVLTYEFPYQRSKELLDGKEVYKGTLILAKDFGVHSNITLNLKYGKDGEKELKEWGFGIKTPVSDDPHGIAAAIEIIGDFDNNWSVLPSVYAPLGAENITFKTGLEFGRNLDSMRANVTLMYRF